MVKQKKKRSICIRNTNCRLWLTVALWHPASCGCFSRLEYSNSRLVLEIAATTILPRTQTAKNRQSIALNPTVDNFGSSDVLVQGFGAISSNWLGLPRAHAHRTNSPTKRQSAMVLVTLRLGYSAMAYYVGPMMPTFSESR